MKNTKLLKDMVIALHNDNPLPACGHPKTSLRSTKNDPECKSTTAYCSDCADGK